MPRGCLQGWSINEQCLAYADCMNNTLRLLGPSPHVHRCSKTKAIYDYTTIPGDAYHLATLYNLLSVHAQCNNLWLIVTDSLTLPTF